MLRRLIFGLVLGLIVGVVLAAGLVRLGQASFADGGGVIVAYLAAAAAGALTGMIAGKPIWASGAKVEGGLKALFGGLMGVGAMFALRQWGTGFDVNLSLVGGGGPSPVGELPAASLPLIAAVLGGLFGLDNTARLRGPASVCPRTTRRSTPVRAPRRESRAQSTTKRPRPSPSARSAECRRRASSFTSRPRASSRRPRTPSYVAHRRWDGLPSCSRATRGSCSPGC
jgi:hypothetical protein